MKFSPLKFPKTQSSSVTYELYKYELDFICNKMPIACQLARDIIYRHEVANYAILLIELWDLNDKLKELEKKVNDIVYIGTLDGGNICKVGVYISEDDEKTLLSSWPWPMSLWNLVKLLEYSLNNDDASRNEVFSILIGDAYQNYDDHNLQIYMMLLRLVECLGGESKVPRFDFLKMLWLKARAAEGTLYKHTHLLETHFRPRLRWMLESFNGAIRPNDPYNLMFFEYESACRWNDNLQDAIDNAKQILEGIGNLFGMCLAKHAVGLGDYEINHPFKRKCFIG